ncbi:H-NS histone family protein [Chitinimonas sp. BJB300]|uniref:H-NS histone family protein n=1 Tax=Chitinimonas sp. BJB300 TaxID=1559339 RepID=UPI000C0FB02B|nr:H-NS histone family protein [Chitinimonas sp. BJB300]PHV12719.1 transcriptional regulator [Chitinimonas sp. BJB300]TSJ90899.1 H-NS histone family protein [Chitinimonas sp. BJB300]
MVDLSGLNLPQLYELEKNLGREIARRKVEDKQKAIADLQKLAADRGFSLSELLGAEGSANKRVSVKRGPVAAQFKNPANPEQTWTGRGRKPQWVADHLASGGSIDALRV